MSQSIVFTDEQYQLLLTFSKHVVQQLKRESVRVAMRNKFYAAASEGLTRQTTVEIIEMLSGIKYSEEATVPFIDALEMHLNGVKKRKSLTATEKREILNQYGFKCPECGRELTEVDFDHIIPFYIVFDTLGMSNIQCLCRECHEEKWVYIPEQSRLVCA